MITATIYGAEEVRAKIESAQGAEEGRMTDLEISPMSAASPDLATNDIGALQASIAKIGQLVPIVLYRGQVLDGRKRLAVCRALDREPVIVTIPDDATASEYATALNLLRTHYTAGQRAMYAAKLATLERGANQHRDNGSSPKNKEDVAITTSSSSPMTSTEAGVLFGINRVTVSHAKSLRQQAAPEVIEAVERGVINLYAARMIVENTPKDEQAAKVAEVIAAPKGKNGRRVPGSVRPNPAYKRLPYRAPDLVIGRIVTAFVNNAEFLGPYLDRGVDGFERSVIKDWLKQVREIANVMRRFERLLKESL